MKPLLIFDYDGTIHNTIQIYETAFRKVHKELVEKGYCPQKEIPSEQIKNWLGMNWKEMWNDFMPELPELVKKESGATIGELMVKQIEEHKTHWYPGVEEVLTKLKKEGYPMVILSNCKTTYKNANWNTFSMGQWFLEFYDCESYDFASKVEIIKYIKNKYQRKSIVIGDRRSDFECARSSGSLFIGCEYGFGKDEELKGADFLAKDTKDILNYIKNQTIKS